MKISLSIVEPVITVGMVTGCYVKILSKLKAAHEKKCLEDTLKEIQEIKKLSKVIVSPETN